jgi:hypothetical protein
MKMGGGEWRYSATFHYLSIRWWPVVRIMPLPLYYRGKSPRYPLDRRLVGSQSRSGPVRTLWGTGKSCTDGNRTWAVQVSLACTTWVYSLTFPLCMCMCVRTYSRPHPSWWHDVYNISDKFAILAWLKTKDNRHSKWRGVSMIWVLWQVLQQKMNVH